MSRSMILQLEFSKDMMYILRHSNIGKVVSVDIDEMHDKETIIIDMNIAELPQYPIVEVRTVERVEVEIKKDELPRVFCRSDFPVVPHLNVAEDGTKELCLFDVPFMEIKYMVNASVILKRIVNWFTKTSRGELHQKGQPLEPFFPWVQNVLILDKSNLNEAVCRFTDVGDNQRKIIKEISINESNEGELFLKLLVTIKKPFNKNIISKLPCTLEELNDAFEDNILDKIEECILTVWSIKQNEKAYKMIFEQKESNIKRSRVVLFFNISLFKDDSDNIVSHEIKAFEIDMPFQSLYSRFGYRKDKSKLIKKCEDIDIRDIILKPFEVICTFERELAQDINGLNAYNCNKKIVQIGLGAVGSQVANNLIRAGYGRWTYIDPDILLPHNLARHSLTKEYIGCNKAVSMKSFASKVFSDQEELLVEGTIPYSIFAIQHKDEINFILGDTAMILDTSASIAVERYLSSSLNCNARCMSFFMTPSGDSAIMLLEDNDRKVTLDLLEMQYYRTLINNDKYISHLESKQKVIYSSSCRGSSLVFPQDNVALFSALCSKAIKQAENNNESRIMIWTLNELTLDSDIIKGETFSYYSVNDWTVRIASSVESKLFQDRQQALPNEIGGVLLGSYDFEKKICYIVDLIESPDDSIQSPYSYIRGCNGLFDRVQSIESITAGNLVYIGEWHSHTNSITKQSDADKILMKSIAQYTSMQSYPGCMIIVGQNQMSIYLERYLEI